MLWTRSETLGLAAADCTICEGVGLPAVNDNSFVPCQCVARKIFNICLDKFHHLVQKEKTLTKVSLDAYGQGNSRGYVWGRKDEEYIADFMLLCRRHLSPAEWEIFSFRHLLGADWTICCRRLGLEKAVYYRRLYKIEAKLGLALRETAPYPLFPLDEYFNGSAKKLPACSIRYTVRPEKRFEPVRPPMAA